MSKQLSISQKKEWAEMLFIQRLTQKEIAKKVGVSETTLSKWVNEGLWDKKRKTLLTTKSEILRFLYDIIDKLRMKIQSEDGIGDTKQADMVVKYTAAIKALETETSISVLMDAGMQFHKHLQLIDPIKALDFLNEYDGFIKDKIKRI